jgi:hypothetical protein
LNYLLFHAVPFVHPTILGFSRREREAAFERVDLLTREAGGCKPVLGSSRARTVFAWVCILQSPKSWFTLAGNFGHV